MGRFKSYIISFFRTRIIHYRASNTKYEQFTLIEDLTSSKGAGGRPWIWISRDKPLSYNNNSKIACARVWELCVFIGEIASTDGHNWPRYRVHTYNNNSKISTYHVSSAGCGVSINNWILLGRLDDIHPGALLDCKAPKDQNVGCSTFSWS